MLIETPYAGYAGEVWQNAYATLQYYVTQVAALTTANSNASGSNVSSGVTNQTTAQTLELLSEGMFTTLYNAVEAINVNNISQAWYAESINLQQIQALPLTISPTDSSYINARITAYENAQASLATLIPAISTFQSPAALTSGLPTIPHAGLVTFFETFAFETPPAGLTNANLLADAQAVTTAFQDLAAAISTYQGAQLTQLYDVAIREAQCAASAANIIASLTSGPLAANVSGLGTWNQIVASPAMSMCADTLIGAPFTAQAQQQAIIRNVMIVFMQQVSTFLLSLRQPITTQVNLTTLLNGESLLDVAARTLGNFEQWENIAVLNNLVPPYVGPSSASGIAGWGSQLILPTPGTAISATGAEPSYANNFLGIDIYIGPINGAMPAWNGDFQTIAGYANLAWALGRRIQTPQGSLIYAPIYGSRIPPEVGAVQDAATAGHITAFGVSALLADPRVASVPAATTTLVSGGLVSFSANAQPSGFESALVSVNQVLSPLP